MPKIVVEKVEGEENRYRLRVLDEEDRECTVTVESIIDLLNVRTLTLNVKCDGEREETIFLDIGQVSLP